MLETSQYPKLLWSISTYQCRPSYGKEHIFANRTRKDKHKVNAFEALRKNICEYSTAMPDQQLDTSAQHKHIWQCDLELQLVNKSYTLTHAVTNQSRTSATYRPCGLRYERKKKAERNHILYIYIDTHTHCLRLVKLKENMRVWTIRSSITIPFK